MELRKLIVGRVVLTTIIIGSGVLVYHAREDKDTTFYLLSVLALVYFFNFIYLLGESLFSRHSRIFRYFQIIIDTIFSSVVIFVTGGVSSPFIFLYPFIIIFAGIFISKVASYVIAALSIVFYLAVVLLSLVNFSTFSESKELYERLSLNILLRNAGLLTLYLHLIGFILLAALGAYLSERLATTREELGESERSLFRLKNLHENILQSLTTGVMTLDFNGRVVSVNKAGMDIIRVGDEEDIVGKNLKEFFHDVEIDNLVDKKRGEIIYKNKDNHSLLIGFSASMLQDTDKTTYGYIIVFQDLTEIRDLEEKAKRAEKMELLGQIAGGLAHELRNPISVINGSIEILASEMKKDDEYSRLIEVATREIERVNLIVEDFLLLTMPLDIHKVNPVDVGFIIRESVKDYLNTIKRNDINVEMSLQPGLFVNANAYRLKQVFWNLLSNAVDSMSSRGGKIKISCSKYDNDRDNKIKIEFSDQGCGIDRSIIPKIFDPFFTTKKVGTGLGLAIVQKIIQGYKGEIEVFSEKGRGTRFVITLPSVEVKVS